MSVVKRIVGHHVTISGEEHSASLNEGVTTPSPTPARDVAFNIYIDLDGTTYFLLYLSQDCDFFGATWHPTLDDAMEAATENFGVRAEQWQTVA